MTTSSYVFFRRESFGKDYDIEPKWHIAKDPLTEKHGLWVALCGYKRKNVLGDLRFSKAQRGPRDGARCKVCLARAAAGGEEDLLAETIVLQTTTEDEWRSIKMKLDAVTTVEGEVSPEVFDIMSGNEQYRTDMETVRAHLERGTFPMSGQRFWGGLEWAVARLTGMEYVGELPYPQPLEEDLRGRHTVAVYERTRSLTDIGFKHRWQARLFSWLVRRSTTEHSAVVGS